MSRYLGRYRVHESAGVRRTLIARLPSDVFDISMIDDDPRFEISEAEGFLEVYQWGDAIPETATTDPDQVTRADPVDFPQRVGDDTRVVTAGDSMPERLRALSRRFANFYRGQ